MILHGSNSPKDASKSVHRISSALQEFSQWFPNQSSTSEFCQTYLGTTSFWNRQSQWRFGRLLRLHFPRWFLPAWILILSATLFLGVIFQASTGQCTELTWQVAAPYTCPQPLVTGLAVAVILYFSSGHGKIVALYIFLYWVATLAVVIEVFMCCHGHDDYTEAVHRIHNAVYPTTQLLFGFLMYRRVKVLESAMMEDLGLRRMRFCVFIILTDSFVGLLLLVLDAGALHRGIGICFWICTIGVLIYMGSIVVAMIRSASFAWDLLRASTGRLEDEARQAVMVVRGQLLGLFVAGATSGVTTVNYALLKGYMWPMPLLEDMEHMSENRRLLFIYIPSLVDSIACSLGALLFAGIFSGGIQAGAARRKRDEHRLKLHRLQLMWRYDSLNDVLCPWHSKVVELAHRGFTLEALLDFYGQLESHMPHYTPSVHTTLDVVRQVIIPLSAKETTSLATVMMKGQQVRPRKIVTHTWKNPFRDLVAAIVADALNDDCFKNICFFLESSLPTLKEWASAAGALSQTYWVCAFSVNQHVSICASNDNHDVDSVTKQEHPICQCGRTKYFNTSEPTTADGRSINCEMNKFDDMMRYLAATSKQFAQVVAVDQKFDLFTRAWCVAELVEADTSGIKSSMKLFSTTGLRKREMGLRNLRVQDMEASRPEDVDEILAKIQDTEKFNKKLRYLIFDGLIADVRFLDAAEQMRHVGRLARWESAMQRLSLRNVPTTTTYNTVLHSSSVSHRSVGGVRSWSSSEAVSTCTAESSSCSQTTL